MKQNFFIKVITLILAGVVLVNTSLTNLSLHFCSGSIAGISLFDKVIEKDNSCCVLPKTFKSVSSNQPDCCQDENFSFYWDADLVSSTISSDDRASVHLSWPDTRIASNINHPVSGLLTPDTVPLPLLKENYQVLFQQFLL